MHSSHIQSIFRLSRQMRHVSYLWSSYKPHVQVVIETLGLEDKGSKDLQEAAIVEIAALNVQLLVEMNKAVGLYASPKGEEECKQNMTANMWIYLLNEGGKQRMLGQKVSRLFFQVAHGIAGAGSSIAEAQTLLRANLISGAVSLRTLIEGSEEKGVGAPPHAGHLRQLERSLGTLASL